MAKQPEDTVTAELPLVKRGRPATGKAMTPAQRKAKQREAWMTTKPEEWNVTICMHVLGMEGLSTLTYQVAFDRLMFLRGHGLGGWFR